jgi:hypothetical protein
MSVIAQFQAHQRSHTLRAAAFVFLALSLGGILNDKTGNIAGVLYRH